MNVLVTGGAGYIGSELVYQLSQQNDVKKIVVYDNLSRDNFNLFTSQSNKITNSKITFEYGELLDSRKLQKALKNIDVVFHLAGKVAPAYADIDSHIFEQVNHWGTAELVYAVENSNVKKFIQLSSTAVYGSSKLPLTEDAIPNPRSFYGTSKLRGEEHVQRLSTKLNSIVLRCGNVYGFSPAIGFETVINKFMFDAHFKNRISIHGNGNQARGFIHIDKVVQTLLQTASLNIPSGVYNLSDKNIEILDIVDVLKEIYPSLEFIFINQHLSMRDLRVSPESKLRQYFTLPETSLKDELENFKTKFSFNTMF
ncbi:MAG: hypothetical protein RL711_1066 [Bacteroidota bacterium]|jgi:UDP-glucose 4-epimerase